MANIRERYVLDKHGRRVGVRLDITDCNDLLRELEEESCARAYDEAAGSRDDRVPLEDAVAQIERERR
jgi:hypothetical protein